MSRRARPARALSRGRPRRRRGDRAADRHHARLRGRQLGAFRLAGRQPRDARLRPDQRGDVRRQELVRAPLARRRHASRSACSGRSPSPPISTSSSSASTPIFLVSDPTQKWKLLEIFLADADAVPRRRGVPRLRVPQEQPDVRPRLFRRSRRLGPVRPRRSSARCIVFTPANLIAAPLALWLAACVAWSVRPGRQARARALRRPSALLAFGGHFVVAPALGLQPPRGQRLQGRLLRAANSPTRSASTRASRRSAISRPIRAPICISRRACPTTPASTCRTMPANAYLGLYIDSDGPIGVMRDLHRQGDGLFPLPADVLPLRDQEGAEDLHHAVRRRHLDRGRAAFGRQGRHRRRRQSRRARGLPRPGVPRFHRRHPRRRCASSTTRAAISSPRPTRSSTSST